MNQMLLYRKIDPNDPDQEVVVTTEDNNEQFILEYFGEGNRNPDEYECIVAEHKFVRFIFNAPTRLN